MPAMPEDVEDLLRKYEDEFSRMSDEELARQIIIASQRLVAAGINPTLACHTDKSYKRTIAMRQSARKGKIV